MRRSQSTLRTVAVLWSCARKAARSKLLVPIVRSCHSVADSSETAAAKSSDVFSSAAVDIVNKHNIPIERVSLSRGLALNRFEKDFFIYPEYTETDAAENVLQFAHALREDIKRSAGQEGSVATVWNKHSLFSYTIPKKYGGVDMCYKDFLMLCEGLGSAWSLYTCFEQTYLAASLILLYGNEQQKAQYLPQIASGALRPAVCLFEPHMCSDSAQQSAVCKRSDGVWKLSATKQRIITATEAATDLFFVFAWQDEKHLACYLIERNNVDALKMMAENSLFGRNGLKVNLLDFNDVTVEPSWMLGSPDDGIKIAQKASLRKTTFGTAVVGFAKTLISNLSQYCNTTLQQNLRLAEKDDIKHLITKLALNTYVLESMCYYVGGLYDEELVLLVDVEEAVIHKCARNLLSKALSSVMDIMGMNIYSPGMNFDEQLNEIMTALVLSATPLDINSFIASKIITSYANTNADTIKQWRSFNGRFYDRIFGQAEKAVSFYEPRLKHFMAEHAHPSLKEACISLEHTMWRLDSLLDVLISKRGKSIISDNSILSAVSKVIECNLGMVTTIARSTRSYSIGLRNSDLEISWTHLYCSEAANTSVAELRKLYDFFLHERLNPLHSKIGQTILDTAGYCIESPITRNW